MSTTWISEGSREKMAITSAYLSSYLTGNESRINSSTSILAINRLEKLAFDNREISISAVKKANLDILKIFTFKFLEGEKENITNQPNQIILNSSSSKALFGSTSPMGKVIELNRMQKIIVGVFED